MEPNEEHAIIGDIPITREALNPERSQTNLSPGYILRNTLIMQDITVGEFSQMTGMDRKKIRQIIAGNCKITPDVAQLIGNALGTPDKVWTNLQESYDGVGDDSDE